LNLGKAEETTTGIVIDATIVAVAMTVTGTETMTAPAALIRGEGNVLDPGNAAGIAETSILYYFPLSNCRKFAFMLVDMFLPNLKHVMRMNMILFCFVI
jgi:hypothetical protein